MSKVKSQKLYFLIYFLILFFTNCSEEPPISEEKFIKLYVDLLIIDDTTDVHNKSVDSLKALVFSNHNVTPEKYFSTVSYYKSNPEKWEEIFDKAIAYAEGLKDSAAKKP